MAAFYAWLLCLFYSFAGCVCWDRFILLRLLLRVHSEIEKIIHRVAEILLTAKITFRGLHRCVAQQKLNLLDLAASVVAQFRTSSPQIMRGNVL